MSSWNPGRDPAVNTHGDLELYGHDGQPFVIHKGDVPRFLAWFRIYGDDLLLLSLSGSDDDDDDENEEGEDN